MQSYVLQQFGIDDVKSILENHRELMKKEIEELINENSQSPVLVPRAKLLEMLDCSASWLSKVTTNGQMPSLTIGGRVFYDLRQIKNSGSVKKFTVKKNNRRAK